MSDHTQTLIPALNPGTAKAVVDLRGYVNRFVQLNDLGISIADARSHAPTFLLMSQANSGQDCQINYFNVGRATAGAAITRGHNIEVMSVTGLATGVASRSATSVGFALVGAVGSGELFSVKLY